MPIHWRLATYLEPIGGIDEGEMIEVAVETFGEFAEEHTIQGALERQMSKLKNSKRKIEAARKKRREKYARKR